MRRFRKEYKALIVVMLVGLINGLAYVWLLPPWQHYDEPNHFEYAWLIAKRGSLPKPGDYDQDMHRATAISMIEHKFFVGMNFLPDLNPDNQPIWIGQYSQLGDPPLYYLLGSLPLLLPVQDITTQLYLVRMVSLVLYLITIIACWGIMTEITSTGNPMRVLVPLTIALLPGFTDVMTSVSNLVAATAFFSLCLWGCVRLLVKGVTVINLVWAATGAALCMFTSVNAYLALPIFIFSLLLAFFHGKWRMIAATILIGLGGLTGLVFTVRGGDAVYWYRSTLQEESLGVQDQQAVLGERYFQVDTQAEISPKWLVPAFQSLGKNLPAGKYTFGAWMWANKPMRVQTPEIGVGSQITVDTADIDNTPTFHSFPVTIKKEGQRTWVSLAPKAGKNQEGLVFYDGLVLAKGKYPTDQAPIFNNAAGEDGMWGGKSFINLVRNASAEEDGLRFISTVDRAGAKILPDNTLPSLILTYIIDWTGASWLYRDVGRTLFRSFWGTFGWGHVPLASEEAYLILRVITLLAVTGCVIKLTLGLIREKGKFALPKQFTWDIMVLFGLALVIAWGSTWVRGASYLGIPQVYIPVARYALPAIIPIGLILAGGLISILFLPLSLLRRWQRNPKILAGWIYSSCLLIFNLYALWSIYQFYKL